MGGASETSTSRTGYVAAYSWSERLNDPPRVQIPPPNLEYSEGHPSLTVRHSTSMDYDSNQFGSPALVQALITNGSVTLTHKMLDWKYANRREAQMILPFLYVGPLSAVKDEKFVQETGFTFLMSVRSTASGPTRTMDAVKMASLYGITRSHNLDVDSATDLIRKFPAAIKAINDHLEETTSKCSPGPNGDLQAASIRGRVLVFCETGNERSAAFVAAYLMAVFSIDVITALQAVQSQRFSMCVDDSTKNALGTFEALLTAKRDVGRANKTSAIETPKETLHQHLQGDSTFPIHSKRTLDDFCNDDGAMETNISEPRHAKDGRVGAAPFHDMDE